MHRWTWKSSGGGEGWLAVMPADGSAAATDIGPRIPGGEDSGLGKTWSPHGSRVGCSGWNPADSYRNPDCPVPPHPDRLHRP